MPDPDTERRLAALEERIVELSDETQAARADAAAARRLLGQQDPDQP